ncbi:MAG: hypothetical protein LUQ38_03045 [Methanotrichaceae archaeon]|nr:hypothetical protein [Methanotrichaceae archaeon]
MRFETKHFFKTKDVSSVMQKIAKDLLKTLKDEKIVLDSRKRCNQGLWLRSLLKICSISCHEFKTKDVDQQKCEIVYRHVFLNYIMAQHRASMLRPRADCLTIRLVLFQGSA